MKFVQSLAAFGLVVVFAFSCQKKSATQSAGEAEKSQSDLDSKIAGVVYGETSASLGLASDTKPTAGAEVKIYKLDPDTLAPTLLGKSVTDAAGAYAQFFNLGETSTILVIATAGSTPIGQTIVAVPPLGQSLAGDPQMRVLTADITKVRSVATSLLLSKSVKLASLSEKSFNDVLDVVEKAINGEASSADISTLVQTFANSSTLLKTLSDLLADSGITSARSNSIISTLSDLVPTLTGGSTLTNLEIELNTASFAKGLSVDIKAYGTYSDNTRVDVSSLVTWKSSATSVATITKSSGTKVQGAAIGNATITATLDGKSAQKAVTITAATLVSLDLTPKSQTFAKSTYVQFTATGVYTDNSTQNLTGTATWVSDDTSVATVNDSAPQKGLVFGQNAGSGSVTASVSGVTGQISFTVSNATLSSVQVTPANVTIAAGVTQNMTATGLFSDSSTQDLTAFATWASDDTNIATVSNASGSRGRVTAISTGTANISASFASVSGQEALQVSAADLTSIQLTPATASLAKGTTTDIVATGIYSDNTNTNITDQTTWSSSNTSIATVSTGASPRGRITAVNTGTATITATNGSETMTLTVTVTPATLSSIAVTAAGATTPLGNTRQYTATGTYSDGSTQDLTTTVTWASSATAKATISNAAGTQGLATTVAVGSTTISASLNAVSGSTSLTISAAELTSIAITPSSASAAKGSSKQFTATGTYTDGTTQDITTAVTWTSSSTSVATISNASGSEGLASTVAVGSTTITATLNAISGTKNFNVTAAQLVSIAVTPSTPSVAKGSTKQFVATGTYTDASTQDLSTQVTWQSSSTSVATISNVDGSRGLATSASTGSTTISAAFSSITGDTQLTVTAAELVSIAVSASSSSVAAGLTRQMTATGTYTDNSTQNLTASATWASDAGEATVDSNGLATGVSVGSAHISATIGAISGSLTLNVTTAQLTSIAVSPSNASIGIGATQQYAATGTYSDASTADVTSSATWTSSDTAKATIGLNTGLATGVALGSSNVTATIGSISGSTSLTVAALAPPPDPTGQSAVADSTSQITVSWASGGGTTASYKVAYQTGSAPADCASGTVVTSASTSKAITSLSASTTYYFRICALNSNGTPDVSSGVTTNATTLQAAPPDPSGQSATADSTSQITVSWASGGGSTASYKVAYQTGSAPADCASGTVVTSASTSKAITSLSANTAYYFRICALNSNGTPDVSSGVTTNATTLQAAPPNPSGQSATADSSSQITVSWASGGGSTASYKVAYQTGSAPADCASGTVVTSASTSKAITSLSADTAYYFRICALNSNGAPDVSSGVTTNATTLQAAPPDPSGQSATADSSSQITVSWTSGGGSTASYKVAYQTGSAPADCASGTVVTSASTSKAITSLSASTTYYFRICALNSNGTPDVSSGVTTNATTSAAAAANQIVFVSSGTQTGALGGISGANTKCQTYATNAGLSGTYKAIISTSTQNAADNIVSTGNVYDTTGVKVASNGIFGGITVKINHTETGALVSTAVQVWTGSDFSGYSAANTCTDFTIGNGTKSAQYGTYTSTTTTWLTSTYGSSCNSLYRLYCISQ